MMCSGPSRAAARVCHHLMESPSPLVAIVRSVYRLGGPKLFENDDCPGLASTNSATAAPAAHSRQTTLPAEIPRVGAYVFSTAAVARARRHQHLLS